MVAKVDLALTHNYISRRLLHELGAESGLTATEATHTAILLGTYFVEASEHVKLDFVAGRADTLFNDVDFAVYGGKDDLGDTVPDVVVGLRTLRRMKALALTEEYAIAAKEGVDVWLAYKGPEQAVHLNGQGHDEL